MLNLIQSELCHPDAIHVNPGPVLYCSICQVNVLAPYAYINQPFQDHLYSSQLAQAYADWTGDEQVPMSFPVSHCEGIYDSIVKNQPLFRVRRSIRLLRALNAPFTTQPSIPLSEEDTTTFLPDFLHILYEHPTAESTHERTALNTLIKCMHDILASKEFTNPFDLYFQTLVPYVQTCFGGNYQPFDAETELPNFAQELHVQLVRSHCIRKHFSRFAIPFDVLHVMVASYACSSDLEVVGNWAIDFMARICKGEFYWKHFADSPLVGTMQHLVASEIDYNKNAYWFQNVIRPIRRGESIEHYSQIWQPLLEVKAHLKRKYTPLPPGDMLDLAFNNLFPAVLFSEYPDALGFILGFNHLFITLARNHGRLPKGTCKKSKLIHGVAKRFIERVRDFDAGGPTLWNLNMVKLFFASDENFHQEIMQVIHILMEE